MPKVDEKPVIDERYIPAAGWRLLTPLFDPVMRVTTREQRWRRAVVDQALASTPMTILDVGCGTGTLAVQLACRAADVRVIGLDGDPNVLKRAAAKAEAAAVKVELLRGMADSIPLEDASVDSATSTLLFHHLAPDTKARVLAEIRRVLRPGGRLVIADYGRPQDRLMRAAFLFVQLLDGFQSTREHVAGRLPDLIADAGYSVETISRLRTISGALELLIATTNVPHGKDHVATEASV